MITRTAPISERREYNRAYRKANLERLKANGRRWYLANRERVLLKMKSRQRERSLWYFHRLTLEDYQVMENRQGGKCAVCQKKPDSAHTLVVDHNHGTKTIRGLLCGGCNTKLAWLENYRERIGRYMGVEIAPSIH